MEVDQQIISLNETSGVFLEVNKYKLMVLIFQEQLVFLQHIHTQSIKSVEDLLKFKGDTVCEKFRLPENVTNVVLSNGGVTSLQ